MPEGPSIVILKELILPYKGKLIKGVSGNAKIDLDRLKNKKIIDIKSWGKHFLICLKGFYVKIHLLMFGSYLINQRKEIKPRMSLLFKTDEINFYNCSIKIIEGDVNEDYDWEVDIMADEWNALKAEKALSALKKTLIADALLDQEIFSGLGNIIKNEVLFNTKIHPTSLVDSIAKKKIKSLVKEIRDYSFRFYAWKKDFVLRKHWLIYAQKECPRCKIRIKREYLGVRNRISYFCNNCQILYNEHL